jgi:hypothetical protein
MSSVTSCVGGGLYICFTCLHVPYSTVTLFTGLGCWHTCVFSYEPWWDEFGWLLSCGGFVLVGGWSCYVVHQRHRWGGGRGDPGLDHMSVVGFPWKRPAGGIQQT